MFETHNDPWKGTDNAEENRSRAQMLIEIREAGITAIELASMMGINLIDATDLLCGFISTVSHEELSAAYEKVKSSDKQSTLAT